MRSWLIAALLCTSLSGWFGFGAFSEQRAELQRTSTAVANEPPATRFKAVFERWRAGNADSLTSVREIADEMCRDLNRCDVPRIVEHYARLTPEERAAGMRLEQQVNDLRIRLGRAYAEGVQNAEWEALRVEIEAGVELAWTHSRSLADHGARAQASSLRAEYFVARLEKRDAQLVAGERAEIAQQIETDARDALADFADFGIVRAALYPQLSLARIEQFRGRLVFARAAFNALAESAAAVGDTDRRVDAYQGMLSIANERADEIEGDRCLEALATLRHADKDWPLARAWAMRLIHRDRAGEALEFLDEFRAPDADDNSSTGSQTRREIPFFRAMAYLREGNLESARSEAEQAARVKSVGVNRQLLEARELRFLEARIDLAAGKAQDAITSMADPLLLEALSPHEEGAARTLLGQARLAQGDALGAVTELKRALQLADLERQRALVEPLLAPDEARRFNFIGEWEGAGLESVALLTHAHLALGDALLAALTSENWQSRSLRGDDDELAVQLARSGLPSQGKPLASDELRAWAGTTELGLVTWIFGADSGAVVHVKIGVDGKLDCAGERIDLGREDLRDAVRRLRERAIAGSNAGALVQDIQRALFPQSVLAHIGRPHSDRDRLLVLLHGPLESLPIEMLGLGERKFDDELCLLALPGLPAGQPGERLTPKDFERWRLLGSPVDGADSDAQPKVLLPGAGAELAELAKLHPTAGLVQGANFRRPALEFALLAQDCLHIATHLEVKPNETRSRFPAAGLRLDDGDVMSALEIGLLTPRLPLVVLSACESGGGRYADGEGLFGVARAFLEGGTRNLVVTLWPVEDQAAREFALAFHRALAEGTAPSQATRTARRHLISLGRNSADWAAFRFLGRD